MKLLSIVKYPDALLKKKAQPVEKISASLQTLILQMMRAMDANEGVGLAAPQIGLSKRIIVVKDADKNHGFFNPQIIAQSKEKITEEEGCLSLPGIFLKLKRSEKIEVTAQTPNGKTVRITAQGLGARIFQHEIDHLNGKLILNRVSPLMRFKLRKKLSFIK